MHLHSDYKTVKEGCFCLAVNENALIIVNFFFLIFWQVGGGGIVRDPLVHQEVGIYSRLFAN